MAYRDMHFTKQHRLENDEVSCCTFCAEDIEIGSDYFRVVAQGQKPHQAMTNTWAICPLCAIRIAARINDKPANVSQ